MGCLDEGRLSRLCIVQLKAPRTSPIREHRRSKGALDIQPLLGSRTEGPLEALRIRSQDHYGHDTAPWDGILEIDWP